MHVNEVSHKLLNGRGSKKPKSRDTGVAKGGGRHRAADEGHDEANQTMSRGYDKLPELRAVDAVMASVAVVDDGEVDKRLGR